MLVARDVEVRAGARLLLEHASFQVAQGDKIGLVGRNGAGKTTLTRILSGEAQPASGTIIRTGAVGYLPQDPRTGDLDVLAKNRILSARGLDAVVDRLRRAELAMGDDSAEVRDKAMAAYARAEAELAAAGGYAAESEAARIASNLGLPERVLHQPIGTLSGGQRRRVELARILFSGAETLLLDEPTNHLDADSIVWLRDFLAAHTGGLLVISHDVGLLERCANKVFHLDANRAELDIYTMGAKATKAMAAHNMIRRAERLLAETDGERARDRVAKIKFPDPAPCGKTPLTATDLSKSYGSLEVLTDVDLAIDKGSHVVVLGLNGAGKTTLLRILAGLDEPDTGEVMAGHGLRIGYYAQEHETLDVGRSVLANMKAAAPQLGDTDVRNVLGSFLFSGDDVDKPAGVLSGGEKTRLALAMLVCSSANVLLLDEPTNNLDPASRTEVLAAIKRYAGAVVLVTHDEGAVGALDPDRVLLLPDGVEDLWSPEYADLVALA
jgi:ATPase subunit of ABC transporter with duplicated ATPase domains